MMTWRVTDAADGTFEDVDASASPVASTGRVVVGQPGREGGRAALEVVVDGWRFEFLVEDARRAALRDLALREHAGVAGGGPLRVRAVIPGRVVSLAVEPGDDVTAGEPLLVIEAMKMQNELRAPRDGTIEQIAVAPGSTVERGDLLLVLS